MKPSIILSMIISSIVPALVMAESPVLWLEDLLLTQSERTLTGLRIEGPDEVPEGFNEFYTIIAEFDDHDRWQIVCKFQLTSLTAP